MKGIFKNCEFTPDKRVLVNNNAILDASFKSYTESDLVQYYTLKTTVGAKIACDLNHKTQAFELVVQKTLRELHQGYVKHRYDLYEAIYAKDVDKAFEVIKQIEEELGING